MAAATLFSLGLLARPAVADEGGWYFGANGGYTVDTYRRSDLNSALVSTVAAAGDTLVLCCSRVHDKETPWSVDVGYRLSQYLGIEASYIQLGTVRYAAFGKASSFFGSESFDADLNIKSRGPGLALVGVLPMTNDWNLEARLGGYEGKTISQYLTVADGSPHSGSGSETSASLLAGFGTQYIVGAHWVLHLDYTRFNSLGEKLLNNSFNVALLTAGVDYLF
jgi:opacity protein-like surface antigen